MLVLSRKVGESIQIGSDVTLTITRLSGGRVQIGITAPREVAIRRSELGLLNSDPAPVQVVALATEVSTENSQSLTLSL